MPLQLISSVTKHTRFCRRSHLEILNIISLILAILCSCWCQRFVHFQRTQKYFIPNFLLRVLLLFSFPTTLTLNPFNDCLRPSSNHFPNAYGPSFHSPQNFLSFRDTSVS